MAAGPESILEDVVVVDGVGVGRGPTVHIVHPSRMPSMRKPSRFSSFHVEVACWHPVRWSLRCRVVGIKSIS
jgi:hypothetical protein